MHQSPLFDIRFSNRPNHPMFTPALAPFATEERKIAIAEES
jgi:hypothetical protein